MLDSFDETLALFFCYYPDHRESVLGSSASFAIFMSVYPLLIPWQATQTPGA